MRSRCRCSMCPAIHISSRSWLRSSSTHEPSDPPLRVVSLQRPLWDGARARPPGVRPGGARRVRRPSERGGVGLGARPSVRRSARSKETVRGVERNGQRGGRDRAGSLNLTGSAEMGTDRGLSPAGRRLAFRRRLPEADAGGHRYPRCRLTCRSFVLSCFPSIDRSMHSAGAVAAAGRRPRATRPRPSTPRELPRSAPSSPPSLRSSRAGRDGAESR